MLSGGVWQLVPPLLKYVAISAPLVGSRTRVSQFCARAWWPTTSSVYFFFCLCTGVRAQFCCPCCTGRFSPFIFLSPSTLCWVLLGWM